MREADGSTCSKHGRLARAGPILYDSMSYIVVLLQRRSTVAVDDRLQVIDTDSDTLRRREGTGCVYTSPVGVMSTNRYRPLGPLRSRLAEFEDTSTSFLMSKVRTS